MVRVRKNGTMRGRVVAEGSFEPVSSPLTRLRHWTNILSPVAGGDQGDVAQLGERLPCTQQAGGSNPLISTKGPVRFVANAVDVAVPARPAQRARLQPSDTSNARRSPTFSLASFLLPSCFLEEKEKSRKTPLTIKPPWATIPAPVRGRGSPTEAR
jgi:hypothetical protein